jgi:hypothetical protein
MIKNILCHENGLSTVGLIVTMGIIGVLSAGVVTVVCGSTKTASDQPETISIEAPAENSSLLTSLPGYDPIESQADLTLLQAETDISARQMELNIIQTAVDIMMIQQHLHTLNSTAKTNDMTVFPAQQPLYPRYLRSPHAQYYYSCDSSGEVFLEK